MSGEHWQPKQLCIYIPENDEHRRNSLWPSCISGQKLCQHFIPFFEDTLPHNKSALPVTGSGMCTYFTGIEGGLAWGESSCCSCFFFFSLLFWTRGNFWECLPRLCRGTSGKATMAQMGVLPAHSSVPTQPARIRRRRMRDSCTQIIMERWVSIVRRRWDLNVRGEMCESQEVNLAGKKVKDERKAT